MTKSFICNEETEEHIIEFEIGYMINPKFHDNKAFKEKVYICMNNTLVQAHNLILKIKFSQKDTSVLELLIFHETIGLNPNKAFRLLSCVIHTIIDNYVCIDYLACQ